jgi:chromosome segregation ATPase
MSEAKNMVKEFEALQKDLAVHSEAKKVLRQQLDESNSALKKSESKTDDLETSLRVTKQEASELKEKSSHLQKLEKDVADLTEQRREVESANAFTEERLQKALANLESKDTQLAREEELWCEAISAKNGIEERVQQVHTIGSFDALAAAATRKVWNGRYACTPQS